MITSLRCIHGKVRTSTIELLRSLRKARNWGSVLSVLKPSIQRLSWFSDIGDLCNKDAVWFPGSLLTLHARRITLIFFFTLFFLTMRLFLSGQPHQLILTFGQSQNYAKTPQVTYRKAAAGIHKMYNWNIKLVLLSHFEIVKPYVLQLYHWHIFRIYSSSFWEPLYLTEGI